MFWEKIFRAKNVSKLIILVLLIGFIVYFSGPKHPSLTFFNESDSIDFNNGDIILRRGKSLISQIVLLKDKDSEYSHVGIVVIQNDQPYVVHAVPGEAEKDMPEYVKMETMQEFLDSEKTVDFAVYTMASPDNTIRQKVAEKALTYFNQHIEFDSEFNLADDSRLYCTELVWQAYKAAGINLIKSYDKINIPFYKGDFIYPSDIFKNPNFKRLYPN
ncbi:MAG: YiiX/YebB-like N1pC/P60 family cysteine hydrolase [Bacteroidales bacterium]